MAGVPISVLDQKRVKQNPKDSLWHLLVLLSANNKKPSNDVKEKRAQKPLGLRCGLLNHTYGSVLRLAEVLAKRKTTLNR